jgi:hypothetical protein
MHGQSTKPIWSITTDDMDIYRIHISDIEYVIQFINMPIGERNITLCDIYNKKYPYFSSFGIATKHPGDALSFEIGQKVSLRNAIRILYKTCFDMSINNQKRYKAFFGRLSTNLSFKEFRSMIKSEIYMVKNDKV